MFHGVGLRTSAGLRQEMERTVSLLLHLDVWDMRLGMGF